MDKDRDIWFTRYEHDLYASWARPGDAPRHRPRKIRSVAEALARLKANGYNAVQVGILPPDMIGLEDLEV